MSSIHSSWKNLEDKDKPAIIDTGEALHYPDFSMVYGAINVKNNNAHTLTPSVLQTESAQIHLTSTNT